MINFGVLIVAIQLKLHEKVELKSSKLESGHVQFERRSFQAWTLQLQDLQLGRRHLAKLQWKEDTRPRSSDLMKNSSR